MGMDAFPPMERNACIVRGMHEKAHARLTYTGYGFLLLAEYRFHDFMANYKNTYTNKTGKLPIDHEIVESIFR